MPDTTTVLTTIDLAADLAADVQAVRGWLARLNAGHELTDRERDAVARHLAGVRDNAAAVLHGAQLIGLSPAEGPQGAAGDSGSRGRRPKRAEKHASVLDAILTPASVGSYEARLGQPVRVTRS
jgi:hypothetical protein